MILVNLFGGPGSGKSTTAAFVFAHLKLQGVKAELVGEEAKDLVFNQAIPMLDNQILLLGQQYQRTKRLKEAGAEIAICDSPFALSILYGQKQPYVDELTLLVRRLETLYTTVNIFVKRVKPYVKFGRYQEAEEAAALDKQARDLLRTIDLEVPGNEMGAVWATNYLFRLVNSLRQQP